MCLLLISPRGPRACACLCYTQLYQESQSRAKRGVNGGQFGKKRKESGGGAPPAFLPSKHSLAVRIGFGGSSDGSEVDPLPPDLAALSLDDFEVATAALVERFTAVRVWQRLVQGFDQATTMAFVCAVVETLHTGRGGTRTSRSSLVEDRDGLTKPAALKDKKGRRKGRMECRWMESRWTAPPSSPHHTHTRTHTPRPMVSVGICAICLRRESTPGTGGDVRHVVVTSSCITNSSRQSRPPFVHSIDLFVCTQFLSHDTPPLIVYLQQIFGSMSVSSTACAIKNAVASSVPVLSGWVVRAYLRHADEISAAVAVCEILKSP